MGHQSEYSKARQQFIVDQDNEFSDRLRRLQAIFLALVIKYITIEIEHESGTIKPTIRNYTKARKFADQVTVEFYEAGASEFIRWIALNYQKLYILNVQYFREVVGRDIQAIADRIWKAYTQRIGYNYDKGSFIEGAFLLGLIAIPDTLEGIKRLITRAIQIGESISDLATTIRDWLLPKPNQKNGKIETEIGERASDTYAHFDRDTGMLMSDDLQLNYAIYQGGIIKTTRDFCYVRNDLVFSREQIEKFGTPTDPFGGYIDKSIGYFAGKSDPYDPFRDLGGYNCRHMLDWISDELAEQLLGSQRSDGIILG